MPDMDHPLRAVLERVDSRSCPESFNFHCHTLCSDGSLDPIELIEQATRRGLSQLAVTDHHSSHAHAPMRAWLDDQRSAGSSVPTLWSGMEISALLKGCLVHVLALGFELDHPALRLYNRGDAVVGEPLRAASVVAAIPWGSVLPASRAWDPRRSPLFPWLVSPGCRGLRCRPCSTPALEGFTVSQFLEK